MTLHLADMATYQGTLSIADLKLAGVDIVNFKTSHGLGLRAVRAAVTSEVAAARSIGMTASGFHFLTGDASGIEQAKYVHTRLKGYGLLADAVHIVDVETNPVGPDATLPIVRDYIMALQDALQRYVMVYTGRRWWRPKGWDVSDLTPYLHAAPAAGYLGSYPGDASPHWQVDYGGWSELTCMQYGVSTLPGGSIKVSKSAVRDAATWDVLKKGAGMAWVLVPSLVALREEFNRLAPKRDKGADGSIGDSSHTSSSDHTPDEDSDVLRDHDADSKNEVHALDIDSTGPWPSGRSFASIVAGIIAAEKAKWLSAGDVCRLEYVIYNRKIYSRKRDFAPIAYDGADPHTNHAHFSARYLTTSENDTRPWGVLSTGGSMAFIENRTEFQAELDAWWSARMGAAAADNPQRAALQVAPWRQEVGASGMTTHNMLFAEMRGNLARLVAVVEKILVNVVADDNDLQAIRAEINQAAEAIVAGLVSEGADAGDIAELLRAALGGKAAEVGRILSGSP